MNEYMIRIIFSSKCIQIRILGPYVPEKKRKGKVCRRPIEPTSRIWWLPRACFNSNDERRACSVHGVFGADLSYFGIDLSQFAAFCIEKSSQTGLFW